MNTTMYDYYKASWQGRDFVVCNPQTGKCFAGHFSGKETSIATITDDLDGLEKAGQQSVTVVDESVPSLFTGNTPKVPSLEGFLSRPLDPTGAAVLQ